VEGLDAGDRLRAARPAHHREAEAGQHPRRRPADLAEGFGVLDINDILTFANLFNVADPAADLFEDAAFDINDILIFAQEFSAGCP